MEPRETRLLFTLTKSDFVVETFRSGGPGGQHQNVTDSGVRITHPASGAVGESREYRSQHQNKQAAIKRLVDHPKFKFWHTGRVDEILRGQTLVERVDKMMDRPNLRVEIRGEDGKWHDTE